MQEHGQEAHRACLEGETVEQAALGLVRKVGEEAPGLVKPGVGLQGLARVGVERQAPQVGRRNESDLRGYRLPGAPRQRRRVIDVRGDRGADSHPDRPHQRVEGNLPHEGGRGSPHPQAPLESPRFGPRPSAGVDQAAT